MLQFLSLVTLFLVPFYIFRFRLIGIPTNIFEFSVVVLFVAAMFFAVKSKLNQKKSLLVKSFLILLILFLFSSFLGIVNAGFSLDSQGIFKSYFLIPVILSLSLYWLWNGKTADRMIKFSFIGLYASVLVVSAIAVLQRLNIVTTLFYQSGDVSFQQYSGAHFRAFSIFESPNYLAMFIVPVSLLSMGLISNPKYQFPKFWKDSIYLSLILPLSALIFSQSRAGIIALAGALSIVGIIYLYRMLKNKKFKVMLVFSSIILYPLFIILILKFAIRPEADALRFQIYQFSWRMVAENWLTGVGAGHFQEVLKSMPITGTSIPDFLSYAIHPHNLYLALWLNLGLLGLLSFLAISVWVVAFLLKSKNLSSLFILGSFCAILIHGIFDTTYFKNDLSAIFWLVMAFSLTASNQTPDNQRMIK